LANFAIGVANAGANIAAGNDGKVAVDMVGVVIDVAATAVPGVPGGAGSVIKAERLRQRAAFRQAKREARITTSHQVIIQTNDKVNRVSLGRQQTFKAPKAGR
jgi:hypothetical protein